MDDLFDLIFIDADKKQYIEYFEAAFLKVRTGGFIFVDNTLWSGKVLKDIASNDAQSLAVSKFNDYIANDSRIEKIILPIRDGLTIIYKK